MGHVRVTSSKGGTVRTSESWGTVSLGCSGGRRKNNNINVSKVLLIVLSIVNQKHGIR